MFTSSSNTLKSIDCGVITDYHVNKKKSINSMFLIDIVHCQFHWIANESIKCHPFRWIIIGNNNLKWYCAHCALCIRAVSRLNGMGPYGPDHIRRILIFMTWDRDNQRNHAILTNQNYEISICFSINVYLLAKTNDQIILKIYVLCVCYIIWTLTKRKFNRRMSPWMLADQKWNDNRMNKIHGIIGLWTWILLNEFP